MLHAFRQAWRSITHSRTRSILLVIALALPLAGVTTWFAIRATGSEPPAIMAARQVGQAEVVVGRATDGSTTPLPEQLSAAQGALANRSGMTAEPAAQVKGFVAVTSASGAQLNAQAFGRDPLPVFEGRHLLEEGRWPNAPDEIAVSPAVATAFAATIGGSLIVDGRALTVVGIGIDTSSLDARFDITTLDTGLSVIGHGSAHREPPPTFEWFLTSAPPTESLTSLEGDGWSVTTRESVIRLYEAARVFDSTNVYLVAIAACTLGELTLIMAGVYAVQFQGRVREQALLAALGASPRYRRLVVVVDGLLIAGAAALMGVASGLVAAWLLAPQVAASTNQRWEVFQIPYAWIGLLVAFVLCAGGGAAYLATRFVTQDLATLLKGGPRPVLGTPTAARLPVKTPLAAVALGVLGAVADLPVLVIAGVASLICALLLAIRYQLTFYRPAAEGTALHLLAWRATTSQPYRTLTFIAIPMSMVAIIGLLSAVLGGVSHAAESEYVPQGPTGSVLVQTTKPVSREAVRQAGDLLSSPGVALLAALAPAPVPRDENGAPFTYWGHFAPEGHEDNPVYLAEEGDVVALLGRPLTPEEQSAFHAGSVLSRVPAFVNDGSVTLVAPDSSHMDSGAVVTKTLPSVVVDDLPGPQRGLPVLLMSTPAGQSVGVRQPDFSIAYLASPGSVPDDRAEARARGVLAAEVGSNFVDMQVERGSTTAGYMRTIIAWSFVGLIVATLATTILLVTLTLHEQRRTFALLSAMGGTGRQRASVVRSQTLVPVALGAVAGAIIVLLGAPPLVLAQGLPLTSWPAITVSVAVVLVVLVATAGGRLYPIRRASLRPQR